MSKKKIFEQIDFSIRPSKQIERKLFIELIQNLSRADIFIGEYEYIGFGSIYYIDFIMFHKYLHIKQMTCVEREDIPNRMAFNKPYDFIQLFMGPLSDLMPDLKEDNKYLIWLDENKILTKEMLSDINNLIGFLSNGSILFITVNAQPNSYLPYNKIPDTWDSDNTAPSKQEMLITNLTIEFGKYAGKIDKSEVTKKAFPQLLARILKTRIETSMLDRKGDSFYQLINYRYDEGTQMLTIGGIINSDEKNKDLEKSGIYNLSFTTKNTKPIEISVPPLTLREKQWLDKHLQELKDKALEPDFELKSSLLENYLEFYKQYATFHEILIYR